MNKEALHNFASSLLCEETDEVCFACHVSPDGDTLGSAFALARLVRARGRRAFVHVPEAIPETLLFLTEGFDNAPFEPKTVVAVDVSTPDRLGADFPYPDRVRAVIDHHKNNSFDVAVSFVEPEISATGLLVAAVFDEVGEAYTPEVATALYTALSTDTGRFCHTNTTSDVFRLAARLCECVPEGTFGALNRRLFVEQDKAKLALEAYILANAETFDDLGCVFFVLTQKLRRRFGLTEKSDLSSLVDVIRRFSGYSVFVLAKEQSERGVYKLSVRSEATPTAIDLCRPFGGGGHEKAAGCTIRARSARALKKIFLSSLEKGTK
ncbi:MAG: DHH family phosphoesterase [Clostridia bacterium]|nr:DHH family phosphoesterase [Clostridia bacterium]